MSGFNAEQLEEVYFRLTGGDEDASREVEI